MGLFTAAELQAGLVAGAAVALAVGLLRLLRRQVLGPSAATAAPWAYGGMVLVGVGLVVLWVIGPLPWELVAGVVGVTAVVDLVTVAGKPAWVRAAAALPFAAFIATAEGMPPIGWFQALVVAAVAGGGALAASTDAMWDREAAAPVLYAVAAAGVYSSVPDTEHALGILGLALWFAAFAWPWPVVRFGAGGAAGSVALLVWGAAYGTRGRPASMVGAVACLGLLAALPVGARLARNVPGILEEVGPRLRVVALGVVQVAVVLFAARTSGLQTSTVKAVALAIPPVAVAIAASTVLRPPMVRRDEQRTPAPLRRPTSD